MKAHLRRWLDRAGYVVFRKRDAAAYARDGHDPGMEWRVHVALWAARLALSTKGDFVECGVNAGFVSSAMMESLNWASLDRTFFLIDTFYGSSPSSSEKTTRRRWKRSRKPSRGAYISPICRA